MTGTLGLDIGGANIKAAHSTGAISIRPFELWRSPARLSSELDQILQEMPAHKALAVTMTAELCDCFPTKRVGVAAILDAVKSVAPNTPARTWSTAGRFLDFEAALRTPLAVAAANWHALATFASRFAHGSTLLVDIGSTTADIIPLCGGRPTPCGLTDYDRLRSGELVYTGVRRTPVCALLGSEVMAELFATTYDAYLMLRDVPEEPENCLTADGKPATRSHAHGRLARMLGGDGETISDEETLHLAKRIAARQEEILCKTVRRIASALPSPPATMILAGSGEFLATRVAQRALPEAKIISLSRKLGQQVSHAACAYAIAILAEEL